MRDVQMLDGSAAGVIWEGTRGYWLWFAPTADGRDLAVAERTRWVYEEFWLKVERESCRVYWGSHGCMYERGHKGSHRCQCADWPDWQTDDESNVGAPPYYGPETRFYGEDA